MAKKTWKVMAAGPDDTMIITADRLMCQHGALVFEEWFNHPVFVDGGDYSVTAVFAPGTWHACLLQKVELG